MHAVAVAVAAAAVTATIRTTTIKGMRLPAARAIFLAGSGASLGCEQTPRVLPESYSDIFPSLAQSELIMRYDEATMDFVTHDGRTHTRTTHTAASRVYNIRVTYARPPRRTVRIICARTHTVAGTHSRIREWKSAHAACPPFASSASPYLIV